MTLYNYYYYYSLPGSSSTCIQQSAPDGFYRDQDCRQMNLFTCEIDKNVAFTQPPEGNDNMHVNIQIQGVSINCHK